jgi:hypothetical protein
LSDDLVAQSRVAEDRAVEVGVGLLQHVGHRVEQRRWRRLDRGGLAEVEERPVGRKCDAFEPTLRLDHRRGLGGEDARTEGSHAAILAAQGGGRQAAQGIGSRAVTFVVIR